MKTVEGEYVICSAEGKICYTEREAGLVINGCKKHFYVGNRRWVKSAHGHSKSIPRRKYFCRECGYYHLTHLALYNIDSKTCVWEDSFYRNYEQRNKRVRA